MRFEACPDRKTLFDRAAEVFSELFHKFADERGRFSVALSGGTTPKGLYDLLAAPPYRDSLPWAKAHVFWSDERCVPPDHAESNYRMAKESLLSKVPVPQEQVHRMRGEVDPDQAARLYESELKRFFGMHPGFDLVLLGMGPDGHTASLFPGTQALAATGWVAANHVEKLGSDRITLTFPILNRSRSVVFLVAGKDKASALEEAKKGANPAGRVKPAGELLWLADAEAAGT